MADMTFEEYQGLPWADVESSNLKRVAFVPAASEEDDDHGRLTVEFHGDRAYVYLGVHRETYEELLEAESVGSFFNAEVKSEHHWEPVTVAVR